MYSAYVAINNAAVCGQNHQQGQPPVSDLLTLTPYVSVLFYVATRSLQEAISAYKMLDKSIK